MCPYTMTTDVKHATLTKRMSDETEKPHGTEVDDEGRKTESATTRGEVKRSRRCGKRKEVRVGYQQPPEAKNIKIRERRCE